MSATGAELEFQGWFQTRLATDPDPTDEPRGVSGYTFALAGEPDLDRIIRFQDPPPDTLRSHGPRVGVTVTAVRLRGRARADHGLLGARVELADQAVHESRNYLMQQGWSEAIRPFHLRIEGAGVTLARNDLLDPARPELEFLKAPQELIDRRGCLGLQQDSPEVAQATGVTDYTAHQKERCAALLKDLAVEGDAIARAALRKRISELEIGLAHPDDRRTRCLGWKASWAFALDGDPITLEPADGYAEVLGAKVDLRYNWPVEFWMGGWDPDALCGYVKGSVAIPLHRGES